MSNNFKELFGNLPFVKFRIVTNFSEDNIRLPQQLFSMIRGTFGTSFKENECINIEEPLYCKSCNILRDCIYPKVFEVESLKEQISIPNTFIIEPESINKNQLTFNFILIGKSTKYTFNVLSAIKNMSKYSFGIKEKKKFKIDSIKILISKNDELFYQNYKYEDFLLDLNRISYDYYPIQKLTIISPINLLENGKLVTPEQFTFKIFFKNLFRRIVSIKNLYENTNQDYTDFFDYLSKLVSEVNITSNNLKMTKVRKYSNRQQKEIVLTCLSGELILSNLTNELIDLLILGMYFHLGKTTSHGLGRYKIEPNIKTIVT